MQYNFATRMANNKPSAIREILKYSSDPSVIAFSAGNPNSETFPLDEIRKFSNEVLNENAIAALQYGITEGFAPLRNALKKLCSERWGAFDEGSDELIVTTGGQQMIDYFSKVLINEGDVVIAEGPSFLGSLSTFKSYGGVIKQANLKETGLDLDEVESLLKTEKNVRFIYVIPNFQNPTGLTMPLETRKGLLELAKKYGVLILEDNPYGELRFAGTPIPTIKSMDKDGIVMYCGSMSKILSSGMRIGFASGPKEIVAKMTVAKQCNDVHTPNINQMICAKFLENCDFDAHIKKTQEIYRVKAELMLDCLAKECDGAFEYTKPEGGLFIWCTLPDKIDMQKFCAKAVKEHKVAVVPGNAFYADDSAPCQSFRINFSSPTNENIEKGIKIICDLAKEMGK